MSRPNSTATGFVRVITRSAGPTAYAQLKLPDGSQPLRKLGLLWTKRSTPPSGYITRAQAEARVQAILEGTDAAVRITRDPGLTFGRAVAEWLDRTEHVDGREASTLRDYRGEARRVLIPYFKADTPLEQITRRDVQAFADKLARDGRLSKRTRQKVLMLLGRIFKIAQLNHDYPTNPVTLIHKGTVPAGEVAYFTHAEVELIADHAETEDDRDLYIVMSRIGHRRGEMVALRFRDVDFIGGQVHVRRNYVEGAEKDPKDHEVRTVPLQDDAAEILARRSLREHYTAPDDLVFGNVVGEHQNPDNLSKRFTTAKVAAGLGAHRGSLENLRHTFATYAGDTEGVMAQDVQRWLGHSDIKTTMRYMGVIDKRNAAALLSARSAAEPGRVHRDVHRTTRNDLNQAALRTTRIAL